MLAHVGVAHVGAEDVAVADAAVVAEVAGEARLAVRCAENEQMYRRHCWGNELWRALNMCRFGPFS